MATPQDDIEPPSQASAAQILDKRRFSHDLLILGRDEIDKLLSTTGKKYRSYFRVSIEQMKKLYFNFFSKQMADLLVWYIIFQN